MFMTMMLTLLTGGHRIPEINWYQYLEFFILNSRALKTVGNLSVQLRKSTEKICRNTLHSLPVKIDYQLMCQPWWFGSFCFVWDTTNLQCVLRLAIYQKCFLRDWLGPFDDCFTPVYSNSLKLEIKIIVSAKCYEYY